jgi:YVTN family beta-propeller protein
VTETNSEKKYPLITVFGITILVLLMLVGITSAEPFAYVGLGGSSVGVVDTATNTLTNALPIVEAIQGVAVSPDGTEVYVSNARDDNVYAINTATSAITKINIGTLADGIAVSPNGKTVYVSGYNNNYIYEINTATNTVIGSVYGACGRIAVRPDGIIENE